ncbi:FAD-linked oxidase-like, C-terminal [Pseudocohnilembus persalinus]|uniref:FAD-linked oxidase-like, C-terminal n=1 Tax=Pseudocohnilembus persalinus TaxID=266149 RepID=A0A0V0QW86_PSEPJ|nr:FAD-linked oxidase-like, C-terminal [Pseudocohnilembus persalinus]|eukprot:KRX06433.1 FAD-linked oxidase-like, C-terminal [Pseudocohnilembus persalinus]
MLSKLFNKVCFSSIQRNPAFKTLQKQDINHFKQILGEKSVKQDELEKYNTDWMEIFQGKSDLVLFPRTTEQLSDIISYCNQNKLAVVPQSGNTGLVGGSVPVFDEIIVNLSKMNKILNYDESSGVLTVEGGVILQEANDYLKQFNSEIPWDLGAKGSCLIGGNIATNAGGSYLVKHGPLRASILGLEVVLPSGEVMDLQSSIRKDNTGIDLKQLFIGSEGILGIITKANILCAKQDKFRNLIYVNCQSYNDVLQVYKTARQTLNKNLAAIEWMDSWAFNAVFDSFNHINNPFDNKGENGQDYYVLVEINSNHAMEELEDMFFEQLAEIEGFKDAIKAQNESQFKEIWEIRESCQPAASKLSQYEFKYDISLDISLMDNILQDLRNKLQKYKDIQVIGYGHIGDGNLHINVILGDKSVKDEVQNILEPYIFQYLSEIKGSISAEHGMGQLKSQYLELQKPKVAIDFMKKIKQQFDPNNILNPYKCLP